MTAPKVGPEPAHALHDLLATHLSKPGEPQVFLHACGLQDWFLDLSPGNSPRENAAQILGLAQRHGLMETVSGTLFQEVAFLEKRLRTLRMAAEGAGALGSGPRILVHNQHLAELEHAENPSELVRLLDLALDIVDARPWEPDYWAIDLVDAATARAVDLLGMSPEARQMLQRVDLEEAETLGLLRAGMSSTQFLPRRERRHRLLALWGAAWPRLLEVVLCRFRSFQVQLPSLRGLDLEKEVDAAADEALRRTAAAVRCLQQAWDGPAEGESWHGWSAKLEQTLARQDSQHRLSPRLQAEARKARNFYAWADRSRPAPEPEGDTAWAWRWRGRMAIWKEQSLDAAQFYLIAALKSREEQEPVCLRLWTLDAATEATLAAGKSQHDEVARLTEALSELSGSTHAQEVHELRLEEVQSVSKHAKAVQLVLHGVRDSSQQVSGGPGVGGRLREFAEAEGLHPATVTPWAQAECWTRWSQRKFGVAMEVAFRHGLLKDVRTFVHELQHIPVGRQCTPWIRSWAVRPRHRGELYARAEALATLAPFVPDTTLDGLDQWVLDAIDHVGLSLHRADQDAHLAGLLARSSRMAPGRLEQVRAAVATAPVTEDLENAFLRKILGGLPAAWKDYSPTTGDLAVATELLRRSLSGEGLLRESREATLGGMRGLMNAGVDPWDSLSEPIRAWLQQSRSLFHRAQVLAVSARSALELAKAFDQAVDQLLSSDDTTRNEACQTLAQHGDRCVAHLQRVAPSIVRLELEPHPRALLASTSYRAGFLTEDHADSILLDCMEQDFRSAGALGALPHPPPRCRERVESRLAGHDVARTASLSRWGTSPELGVLHTLCCQNDAWIPAGGVAALVSAIRLGNTQEVRVALSAVAGLVRRSQLNELSWSAAGASVAWAQRDERLLVFLMADEVAQRMRSAGAPSHVIAQLGEAGR